MRADRRAGGSDAAPRGMENTRGRSHNTVMGRHAAPIGVCCIMAPLCDGLPSASPVAARQSRRDGSTSAASVGEDRRDWDGRERADSPAGRPVQGRRQATRPSVAVLPRRPSRDLPRRARSDAGKAAMGRAASDSERAKATSGSPRGARSSRAAGAEGEDGTPAARSLRSIPYAHVTSVSSASGIASDSGRYKRKRRWSRRPASWWMGCRGR